MKTLLVLGNDKIAGRAFELLQLNLSEDNFIVVVDKTTSLSRVLKLIKSGTLTFKLVLKMLVSEWRRKGNTPPESLRPILSNKDLLEVIQTTKPERIILFRAGLIISKAIIDTDIPIMNIHCANIPEYGGIGSISRALRDKALDQAACLHIVTKTIDEGEVVDHELYSLVLCNPYHVNENIAYEAGIRLLMRTLTVD